MKRYTTLLLSLIFLCSCNQIDRSPIEISLLKAKKHYHLFEDIWIVPPSGFYKAKSYIGFQNDLNDVQASVSYEKKYVKFHSVKNSFDENFLKTRRTVLLESREVFFKDSDIEFGYFSKVRDMRKNTIRYLLAFPKDGVIHNIKGFCTNSLEDKYDKKIKSSIFSVALAEKIEKVETFKLAKIDLRKGVKYTRDGNFPIENQDIIELVTLSKDKIKTYNDVIEFVDSVFIERIGVDYEYSENKLVNEYEYKLKNTINGNSLLVRVENNLGKERSVLIAYSKSEQIPTDMIDFIDYKLHKSKIKEF